MAIEAFKRQPHCMLTFTDKIIAVMSFWVNHLGWNSLILVKGTVVIGFNWEKRIILGLDLMKKNASLITPFRISEDVLLEKCVKCFKEATSELLKLYGGKMNLQNYTSDINKHLRYD